MFLSARRALCLSLLAVAAIGVAQDPLRDYISVRGGYLGLGQPMPIASPGVLHAVWSSDGRYVLTVQSVSSLPSQDLQSDPAIGIITRLSVRVWDRSTNASTELWNVPGDQYHVEKLEWFTGSDSALAVVIESKYDRVTRSQVPVSKHVLRFGLTSTPDTLLTAPYTVGAPTLELAVSPTRSMGAILYHVDGAVKGDGTFLPGSTSILELRESGDLGTSIRLSDPDQVRKFGFSQDGGLLLGLDSSSDQSSLVVNFRNGRLEKSAKPIKVSDEGSNLTPFRLEFADGATNNLKASRRSRSVWLSSKEDTPLKTTLVAWDISEASSSSRGDAILYISDGIAIVRPVIALDRHDFARIYRASMRTSSMRTAEAVATALMAYARDHAGKVPEKSATLSNSLNSYLQAADALVDFVYLGDGQELSTINRPARTQLGFVRTKVGRAAVFANGSVEWIDEDTN